MSKDILIGDGNPGFIRSPGGEDGECGYGGAGGWIEDSIL